MNFHVKNDPLIGLKYQIQQMLGNGSYGEVFLGINIETQEKARFQHLEKEFMVYKILSNNIGIPRVHFYCIQNGYNYLVMDLLGSSLENLFVSCSYRFTVKTVLMLASQMIERIEYIHSKNFIHGDIKPDNFLMGIGNECNKLFMIDYGLSKTCKESKSQFHISYKEGVPLTGTERFASINAHLGIERSRRDDMESLGYVFMYFLRGYLPWQGLKSIGIKNKEESIKEVKMTTPIETLCKGFPDEFSIYINYCRRLGFKEQPNYVLLKSLFRNLFCKLGYTYDYDFDWSSLKQRNDLNHILEESKENLSLSDGVKTLTGQP